MEFAVWAPQRQRVRVVVQDAEHEMTRTADGWWSAEVESATPGSDYAFRLDEEDTPLPDPRSRRQLDGVHGASRLYDHGAFDWTDHTWTGKALPGSVRLPPRRLAAGRRARRRGRYAEFAEHGWDDAQVPDPNAEETFQRCKLDWFEAAYEPHATLLRIYRELIALRKRRPELSDPRLDRMAVTVDERARTVVLHRGALRVAVNLGAQGTTIPLEGRSNRVLLASGRVTPAPGEALLAGESFAVVELAAAH